MWLSAVICFSSLLLENNEPFASPSRRFTELCLHFIPCFTEDLTPLQLFHILSRFNHKLLSILLGFLVVDEHNVVHKWKAYDTWF